MDKLARAKQMVGLLDFTLLGDSDTVDSVKAHCAQADTPMGKPAAICIYPQFVKVCADELKGTGIRIATVINFPEGIDKLAKSLEVSEEAIDAGADELDYVFPYKLWLAGDHNEALYRFEGMSALRSDKVALKVILETGELGSAEEVRKVSEACLKIGVDFLKTSTGKTATSATPEAVAAMLDAISRLSPSTGLKPSGGIRTFNDADQYLRLAEQSYGTSPLTPKQFRIGASSLLNSLLGFSSSTENY